MSEERKVKVKLKTHMVGHTFKNGEKVGSYAHVAGDEVDLSADDARRYVEQGKASYVKAETVATR